MEPSFEIECSNLNCSAGEYTHFDVHERKYTCRKCPLNTYSEGNDIQIFSNKKEWASKMTNDKIKFGCYTFKQDQAEDPAQNENCSNFSSSNDGSYIRNGQTKVNGNYYDGMVSLFADTYNETTLKITYELKVKKGWFTTNGGITIFNNYEVVMDDDKTSNKRVTRQYIKRLNKGAQRQKQHNCIFLVRKRTKHAKSRTAFPQNI